MAKKQHPVISIGSKAYAVNRSYKNLKSMLGAKVITCKVIAYVNEDYEVIPLYKSTTPGIKTEFTENGFEIFDYLEDAINRIKSKGLTSQ